MASVGVIVDINSLTYVLSTAKLDATGQRLLAAPSGEVQEWKEECGCLCAFTLQASQGREDHLS